MKNFIQAILIISILCLFLACVTQANPDYLPIKAQMANLAIPFIPNEGQMDESVKLYAKTFGGMVFITTTGEIVYTLPKIEEETHNWKTDLTGKNPLMKADGIVLKEQLINSKITQISGECSAVTKVNYFMGKDQSKWKKNILTYNYANLGYIYNGIQLKLKARGNNVEKLFFVNPPGNPKKIRVKIDGAEKVFVNTIGELEVKTKLGDVKFTKPEAYQIIDGTKKYVDVAYEVTGNEYGFVVGEYDETKELVIDPLLASTFLGGSAGDHANSIALDENGNVYITGATFSSDFPVTTGAFDETFNNSTYWPNDVFVSKLDSDLSTLLASTFIGGYNGEKGQHITINAMGDIYVVGVTESANFPTTPGAYDTTYNFGWTKGSPDTTAIWDVFISKFDNTLSNLEASTFLGGWDIDYANTGALDEAGNIFVAGITYSEDFPITPEAYDDSLDNLYNDGFISQLDADLSTLLASTYFNGHIGDMFLKNGAVYFSGETGNTNFPTTPDAFDQDFNGGWKDGFISKLDMELSTLLASSFLGGEETDQCYSIIPNSGNNIFLAGGTHSEDFPTTAGAYDETFNGEFDMFISKMDENCTTLLASTFLGGSDTEIGITQPLVLGMDNNLYIAGKTESPDFPTTPGAYDEEYNGEGDVCISKFNGNLSSLLASTFLGGTQEDEAYDIILDNEQNIYLVGATWSDDFPATSGAYDESYNGDGGYSGGDIFISKLDNDLSSGTSFIHCKTLNLPSQFHLYPNYPNPFNPVTTIQFNLPQKTHVTLNIYDVSGKLVETLLEEERDAGYHSVTWNADRQSSGVYFYRIVTDSGFEDVRKCVMLK